MTDPLVYLFLVLQRISGYNLGLVGSSSEGHVEVDLKKLVTLV